VLLTPGDFAYQNHPLLPAFRYSHYRAAFAALLCQQQRNEIMKEFFNFVKSALFRFPDIFVTGDLFATNTKTTS
jgi:isocitrate dehydrogenase kinase/phosphatase